MIPEYLNPDKSLEERINIIDELITGTKEQLKRYPEIAFPKKHKRLRAKLHSYELTRGKLKEALAEQVIK